MSTAVERPTDKTSRAARAEAAVWIVRLHGEERTPELEAGLREWLGARPENARQFEHITDVWDIGGTVTADGLPRMHSWRPVNSPRPWAIAATVLMVCALSAFAAYHGWSDPDYTTRHGEQRLVRLDDGSRVAMNSDTRLSVALTARERRVRLERGEAYFEVARNPALPFIVVAGDSQVTALGTAFVVRYEPTRVAVTLVEGKVAVKSLGSKQQGKQLMRQQQRAANLPTEPNDAPSSAREIILAPGERLVLASRTQPQLDSPRLDAVTAWRRGEVLLEGTALPDAIAEMNRYDERQLVIDDAALAAVRVSGVYRTGDSPGFARAVAELHGLQIIERAGRIHLQRNTSSVRLAPPSRPQ